MTTETILSSTTEFEAMCNGNGIPLTVYEDGRGYSNERTKAAFIAWQAALQSQDREGWKEAAIAWEVCASIHRKWAKGRDALFNTRQADFTRHAEEARAAYRAIEQAVAQHNEGEDP